MLYPSGQFSETFGKGDAPGFRMIFVSCLAALVGVAAGLVAYLLLKLIGLLTNLIFFHRLGFDLRPLQEHTIGWLVLVVPAIGGLVIGLMAKYGSPKIKGHGIPEAMEAVLTNRSRIQPKVALLKPLSTAIAIGTGGPFGAEGPIIQTGGALGSLVGQLIRTSAAERKVLLACGAAAGMAATFSTPIAGVILAIELLLFEFKSRSFIPLVIASTLATSVHLLLLGRGPLFEVAPLEFGVPANLPWYLLLGLICGAAAIGFTRLLYWVEDSFEALPVGEVWRPAIGGLGLGLIGLFVPRVLGVGYDTITDILNGNLGLSVLLVVMVFKSLALLVSLGSGTSGGLLAPMFMASAALGGALASLLSALPGVAIAPGAFALAAMGAVFGAASRATFAFIIFAFEITQDYTAILPLMLVAVVADLVAIRYLPTTIMTEKLARRGLRVPSDLETSALEHATVASVMDPEPPLLPSDTPVAELLSRLAAHDPLLARHHGLLLVDAEGRLQGILTRSDLLRAAERGPGDARAIEAGSDDLVVTFPDESLAEASLKMMQAGVGRLPVVAREERRRVVGYLGRSGLLAAQQRRLAEEQRREPGWLSRPGAR